MRDSQVILQMGSRRARRMGWVSLAAWAGLTGGNLFGASETWNSTPTDGNWVTTSAENNWSGGLGTYPGSVTGTTNADTATFNSTSITTIAINSPSLNVENITFDGSAPAYTVGTTGGNSIFLSSGGLVSLASTFTGTATTESVNAPLLLEGSYSISNSNATASNALSIGGGVTAVSGAPTLTLNGANTNSSNAVGGGIGNGTATSLAVTKTGAGTWSLNGSTANTYTGGTTVTGGTLLLNDSGGVAIPGNLTLTGTTAMVPNLVQLGASNQIASTATVTINTGGGIANGNNQLDLHGFNNTIAGLAFGANTSGQTVQVTTGAGTLSVTGNISIGGSSSNPISITGNLALTGTTPTISGSITAPVLTVSAKVSDAGGGITQTYPGTVVFSGANTFTGPTSVIAGTLQVATLGNTGETSSSLGAETGANRSITLGSSTGTSSSGTLNYTGGTTSTDHNIIVGTTSGGTDALNNNGAGTLTWNGSISNAPHSMTLGGSGTGIFAGVISITGGNLVKSGADTWTLSNTTDNYTAGLNINQGTLAVSSVNAGGTAGLLGSAAASTPVTISTSATAGVLSFTGSGTPNTTDRTFSLSGNATYPSTIQVGTSGAVLTLTGAVGGTGTLAKTGSGTLTLTDNTYSGNTTVTAGILTIDMPDLSSSSTVSIASGAVLNLGFSDSSVSNTISALILNGVTQGPGIYNAGDAGTFITGTGNLVVSTPEPTGVALLCVAAAGLLIRRRRDPAPRP